MRDAPPGQDNTNQDTAGSTYPTVAALAVDLGLSERSTRAALRRDEIPLHPAARGNRGVATQGWYKRASERNSHPEDERSRLIAPRAHPEVTVMRPSKLTGR